MSSLAGQTAKTATSQQSYTEWAKLTVEEWLKQHVDHSENYQADCRGCLIRAIKNQGASFRALQHVEQTRKAKGDSHVDSIIKEYNALMNGLDYVQPLTIVSTATTGVLMA